MKIEQRRQGGEDQAATVNRFWLPWLIVAGRHRDVTPLWKSGWACLVSSTAASIPIT